MGVNYGPQVLALNILFQSSYKAHQLNIPAFIPARHLDLDCLLIDYENYRESKVEGRGVGGEKAE